MKTFPAMVAAWCLLLIAALARNADAIVVVPSAKVPIVAPVLPHVSAPTPPDQRSALGACFWYKPGTLTAINLYAVTHVEVLITRDNNGGPLYTTYIYMGNRSVDIPIKPGVDTRVHLLSIEKRLAECAQGAKQ